MSILHLFQSRETQDRLQRQLQPRACIHVNQGFVRLRYGKNDWLNELIRFPLAVPSK